MPNEHQFPLGTTCAILRLALKERIKFELPDNLMFRALTTEYPGYEELKKHILSLHWPDKDKDSQSSKLVETFISNKNKDFKKDSKVDLRKSSKAKEKETVGNASHADRKAVAEEKNIYINSYVWAILVKQAVQHGCILDLKNEPVEVARRLFLNQLDKCLEELVKNGNKEQQKTPPGIRRTTTPLQELTKLVPRTASKATEISPQSHLQNFFLEFLGQLCGQRVNQPQSAEALHNFMHIAHKVLHSKSFRDLENADESIGMLFGSALRDALEVPNTLGSPPSTPTSATPEKLETIDSILHVESTEKNSFKVFGKLTAIWIRHPIFAKPFDISFYRDYRQDTRHFLAELEAKSKINSILRDTYKVSFLQMQQKLAELTQPTPLLAKKDTSSSGGDNPALLQHFSALQIAEHQRPSVPDRPAGLTPKRSSKHYNMHRNGSTDAIGRNPPPAATPVKKLQLILPPTNTVPLEVNTPIDADAPKVLCYLAVIPRNLVEGGGDEKLSAEGRAHLSNGHATPTNNCP